MRPPSTRSESLLQEEAIARIMNTLNMNRSAAVLWIRNLLRKVRRPLSVRQVAMALDKLKGDPNRPPGIVHVAKEMAESSRRQKGSSFITRATRLSECPLCKREIPVKALQKHMQRMHGIDQPDVLGLVPYSAPRTRIFLGGLPGSGR